MADERATVTITTDTSKWDPYEWGRAAGYMDASYEWDHGTVAPEVRVPGWVASVDQGSEMFRAGHSDGFDEFYTGKGM